MKIENCDICSSKNKVAANVLTCEELSLLSANTNQLHCSENVEIFKQNDSTRNVYYLKEGIVKLFIKNNYRVSIIKIVNAPSYISLASTLSKDLFICSASTITKSVVCVTAKSTYEKLILNNSAFAFQIIKYLGDNELDQCRVRTSLLLQNLNGRIAGNLIFLSKNVYKNNVFKLSRKDLSEMICQSRESISRVISQLSRENIIAIKGSEIEILDFERLESIKENG